MKERIRSSRTRGRADAPRLLAGWRAGRYVFVVAIASLALVTTLAGCDEPQVDSKSENSAGASSDLAVEAASSPRITQGELAELTFTPARLPRYTWGNQHCAGSGSGTFKEWAGPRSPCDWAHSVDAIFVGEILAVESTGAPYMIYHTNPEDGLWFMSDTCDGTVNTGMKITILPKVWLYGDAEVGPVEVYTGENHFDGMDPFPMSPSTEDNPAGWGPWVQEPPFQLGASLGVAVSWDPRAGKWSLMSESPFTVDEEQWVRIPTVPACEWKAPSFDTPPSLWSFAQTLASCESLEPTQLAQELRTYRQIYHGMYPHNSYAAVCLPPTQKPPCDSNGACGLGEECFDGVCHQVWQP